jgi:hypothetical protein
MRSVSDVLLLGAAAGTKVSLTDSHTFSSAGTGVDLDLRVGFAFVVGAANLSCRSLSVRVGTVGVERVRIHRQGTGALMATADITSVANAWATQDISPVTLSAGVVYVISSRRTDGASRRIYLNPGGLTFNPALSYSASYYGSDDNAPGLYTSNTYAFSRFGFV